MQASEDGDHLNWVFKNKDHGKAAAVASLGLITLWDVQGMTCAVQTQLKHCSSKLSALTLTRPHHDR